MKKRYYIWLLIVLAVLMLSACQNSADRNTKETLEETPENVQEETTGNSTEESVDNNMETGGIQMQELSIRVGGQRFRATLYDNETAQAFMERLPITLNMEELHGNEKFYYLEEGLPTNAEQIDRIQAGDIMLFGSDCLVLFYEDFSTSYSYTRIGHVEDEEAFADALGDGTVEVSFETGE